MINREIIERAFINALGEASALFMSQECKGTEIVMPTTELENIARNTANQLEMVQAFQVLKTHLENDEGYYEAWKANIAMSFKDTAPEEKTYDTETLHKWSNEAADMFLGRLLQ